MERLIKYFVPERVEIKLRINKYTEEVQGQVVTTGVAKNARVLKFHAKGLKISEVSIGERALEFQEDAENELIVVDFAKYLESVNDGVVEADRESNMVGEGEANSGMITGDSVTTDSDVKNNIMGGDFSRRVTINFRYTFKLNHNMEGAYLSTYKYRGKEERIVTTQFESHYAREVFPSIDEPEAKAVFKLKIIDTDTEDTILSNMPVESERVVEYQSVSPNTHPAENVSLSQMVKRKIVEFRETPRMSTYLLAFVMGKFRSLSEANKHGVKVTTYAPLNQKQSLLTFPNQIACEALDLYDDLFGEPYPLPKLDQVAIPDFEAGAMENWGLVTYRQTCLLADQQTSKADREYIATVVTHELSHQWFGDLVTMKWWDNLWLNESFASVMQYLSVDKLHPEWKIWNDFFAGDCYYALRRDSLPGVQAVQQEVNDPAEIATLFDAAIVYAKGARLIFMLMRLMGEEAFFKGLRDYFRKHKYGSTVGDDLWAALQPYAEFDVKKLMDAWILQPGFPMITDGAQQRFLITGATDDTKWPLPEVTDDLSGHYVINLSGDEFEQKVAEFDSLSLEQQLRLLMDRKLLAQTPMVSVGPLMDLLPKFKQNLNEPVWRIVAEIASMIKVFCLPDTKWYPMHQRWMADLAAEGVVRLGLKRKRGEDDSEMKLRVLLVGFLLYAEDEATIGELAAEYDAVDVAGAKEGVKRDVEEDGVASVAGGAKGDDAAKGAGAESGVVRRMAKLDPEMRWNILYAKLMESDEAVFDEWLELYQEVNDPILEVDLRSVLARAKSKEHQVRLLKLLDEPEIVRPQDHVSLLSLLLANFETHDKAFRWLYSHFEYVREMTSGKSLEDYIKVAAAWVRTQKEADEFFEFVEQYKDEAGLARSIEVAKTDVLAKLRWIADNEKSVRKRLEKF